MDEIDFLRGIEGERQQGEDLVNGAEHLVRLKIQSGQQEKPQYPDLELEKKARVFGSHEPAEIHHAAIPYGARKQMYESHLKEKAKENPTGYMKAMLTGGATGAGLGALSSLGMSMRHPGSHALMGAGLGGLAGAGIGALAAHHDKKSIQHAQDTLKNKTVTKELNKTIGEAATAKDYDEHWHRMESRLHHLEKDADLMGSLAIANPTKGGGGLPKMAMCKTCGMEKCACSYGMKMKRAYEIQPSSRPDIPKSDFAQPHKEEAGHEGKYPIPDRQHARSALGFAKMHHDSAALSAVRHKIEQKYPDMLHEGHEKDAGATDGLKGILHRARATLHKHPAARAAVIGGLATGGANAALEGIAAPKGQKLESALAAGARGAILGGSGGYLVHKLQDKLAAAETLKQAMREKLASAPPDWNKTMLATTSGLGALVGGLGTYLASRPQKDTGKGKAEEELKAMVDAQKKIPERGLLHKLKNRETENAHGFAKAFREHPLKAALLGALTGGVSGYGIGQLSGAIARRRGGH